MSAVDALFTDPEAADRWNRTLRPRRAYSRPRSTTRQMIRAMAEQGVGPAAIGRALEVDAKYVGGVISDLRARGVDIPYHRERRLSVVLGEGERAFLVREARERGTDARGLAEALLRTIARDKLVDAVLEP